MPLKIDPVQLLIIQHIIGL